MVVMAARGYLSSRRKRSLDVVVACLASVPAGVVVLVCCVLLRATVGPKVLLPQPRAGLRGAPITVWKLRTMTDARAASGTLLPDAQRMTRMGAALRSMSLDELPQLWNVLRGNMSIVGPRPLPMAYVVRYTPQQRRRLDARPGITGWAQVNGRNALGWPERFDLDVWYVENASLRLDMRILFRTVRSIVRREGVSAEGHVTMHEFTGDA
jgi:lipopolysaccharide/colanic/teichoic acid biosynthesis glycosyltransferase